MTATRVVGLRGLRNLRRAQRLTWPNMINGFVLTRVVQTLLKVGFFDELIDKGRVEPRAFAGAVRLDADILQSLCDALYASHILEKEGDAYQLSSQGRLLIEVGRGWFTGMYGYEPVYHDLEKLLRGEHRYGVDVGRLTDAVAEGSGQIEGQLYFPLAIDVIRRQGYRCLLDLGCGDGHFLRAACRAVPELRGYGIDMAEDAIANAIRLAREAGLERRLGFMAKDITTITETPAPLANVDVATTFFVLHEVLYHGEGAVVALLQGFRRMFPGVPLMVFEVDRPTPEMLRRRPAGMAIPYFLQHDLSHQKPVARDQWPPLFRAAGFERIEERNLAFARSVIFTVR